MPYIILVTTPTPTKTERLEARIAPELKELLRRAASIEGTSVSDFVARSAQREAERIVREHDVIALSPRDSRVFVEALLNPPAPSARLQAAAARHAERVGRA